MTMKFLKKAVLFIFFLSSFLAVSQTMRAVNVTIQGFAFNSLTGNPISSGVANATIKQTGELGNGTVTNGFFNFNITTSLNATNQSQFFVGLSASDGNRSAYDFLTLGGSALITQNKFCSVKFWHFAGTALDLSGALISSGTISSNVRSETNSTTNSTNFSNGLWDIYITPCLISGGLYTFNFIITTSNNQTANLYLNRVAK